MLALMAMHPVPILPSPNPATTHIHSNADMNNKDNNTTLGATIDMSSKTTTSPNPIAATSVPAKMQMNVHTAENVTEKTNHAPLPSPVEGQASSSEIKIDTNGDKSATEASTNSKSAEETASPSSIPPEGIKGNCTISTPAQDASLAANLEEDTDDGAIAGDTVTPPRTEMPTSTELEDPKPAVAQVEVTEATKAEPSSESTAVPVPELSNIEPGEPMDLDVLDNSDDKGKSAVSEDHGPNPPTAENTYTQCGSDHAQNASRDICLADGPLRSTSGPTLDDTTAEVSRLHDTYDSYGEISASRREEAKTEDDSVPGAQAEGTFSDDAKVMVSEPSKDETLIVMTSKSTAEQEEETILPLKPQKSLFGGPIGNRIPPPIEAHQTPKVESVAQIGTTNGFKELFEDEMTNVSTEMNSYLQNSAALGLEFNLEASNTGENAQPDVEEDGESQAVTGAERRVPSPSPNSDHDAKPDVSACPSTTSPAYSRTSSYTSQVSHKTSASQAEDLSNLINSGSLYAHETDNKDTPEEFTRLEQAPNNTHQLVLESVERVQPCNCGPRFYCESCKPRKIGLRQKKEHYVYLNNIVVDDDTSGTYTDDRRYFPSSREVAWEDRNDDEETTEDREEHHLIDGDLIPDNTVSLGRFSTAISHNNTVPLTKDKMPFEEESSSEDDPESKKSKKRKNKDEPTRQAKRPKITDMMDEFANWKPQSFSEASNSVGNTACKITETTDESDIRPTHRRKPKSYMLPCTSISQRKHAELLQDRQPGSGASKPTKKTASKKKTSTKPPSARSSQTIVQIARRLARPLTTKLSYPIHFNSKTSCSICDCPSYAIIGTGSSRNIKVYDFGNGNLEISDANEAGKPQPMQAIPEETSLCMACTTRYMGMVMCTTHDVVPMDVHCVFDSSAAFKKALEKQCTKDELKGRCSLCPAPASYCCDKDCGAKFCDTCACKVHGEHEGNLTAMLEQTEDKISPEYIHGLRADAELLRKGGELEKFLFRMAGANKNRTG